MIDNIREPLKGTSNEVFQENFTAKMNLGCQPGIMQEKKTTEKMIYRRRNSL
jgi:hypothetical protein